MNDENELERVDLFDEELVAVKGIIYLMFVGRKIKAYDIAKEAIEKGFVTKDAVVYQYVNLLQKKGYIKEIEKKVGPGSPKIRTANLEPIFETIGLSRYLVDELFYALGEYSLAEKERKALESLFEKIGCLTGSFPEYLSLSLSEGTKGFRKLDWKKTLYYFLQFCIEVISACRTEKDAPVGKVENYDQLPQIFGRKVRRKIMVKNIVNDAIQTKKLPERDLSALINLTKEGYNDIYKAGSFLQSLYLMALSLTNPETANYIETLINHLPKV